VKKKARDEMKVKTAEELKNLLKGSYDLLFKLRIEKSQNKLKNIKQIFFERKKLAFMLTLINEKGKLEEIQKAKTIKHEKR